MGGFFAGYRRHAVHGGFVDTPDSIDDQPRRSSVAQHSGQS
jgi:hypothetical protein